MLLVALGILALGFCAMGQEQEDDSFVAELDGRKTWTVRFGLGSPLGLASAGLAAGSISLDQSLTVDLRAEALNMLTVEGHFDDRQPESLQSLAVYLDTERLDGVFGDFTVEGLAGFNAQRRKAIGGRLEYLIGPATLTGVAARFEGITESKTFVGATAEGETTFAVSQPDRPWVEMPYDKGIDGLYAYPLASLYVEEISTVELEVAGDASTRAALAPYGMDYLVEAFADEPGAEIETGSFEVIGEDAADQVLLLFVVPRKLARDRVKDAIDAFNSLNDLTGSDAREYPFVEGSAYEGEFLDQFLGVASLRVDSDAIPMLDGLRRQYYDLGRTGVIESSLSVQVSGDGERFSSIDRSGYAGFDATVHGEEGILEIDFPEEFFEAPAPTIRARFSYTVTGGTYMLGFSLVPGSERVTINGAPVEEESYEIDYEIGLLVLLSEVAETDVILVEYERFGSGLGGASDYARYFLGLQLDLPVSESLDLTATIQRGFDDPGSVTDPTRVRTAPNEQTVAGVNGSVDIDGLTADFSVGYGIDVFPPGENARPPASNEITAIAGNDEYTFVGHRSGFSVLHKGVWRGYGTADGLSGQDVRAIVVDEDRAIFGTSAGLTVVNLEGVSPLDRAASWARYTEYEGLGNPSVRSLALWDESLWIGTDEGLYVVPIESIDTPTAWSKGGPSGDLTITSLSAESETLYAGTQSGAYEWSASSETWTLLGGSGSMYVRSMVAVDGLLYVASEQGLRTYVDGAGAGWIVVDESVLAVWVADHDLYYGTSKGLFRASDGGEFHQGWAVTALGSDGEGGLWVGTRANDDYLLMLWLRGDDEVGYDNTTLEIDGRDRTQFGELAAEENTETGFFGRSSFQHAGEGLDLRGDVQVMANGYRAIGSGGSGGYADWSLDADIDLWDGASLFASHAYDLQDRDGEWIGEATNRVSFSGSIGPKLTASIWHSTGNDDAYRRGPESSSFSFDTRISETLFADTVDVSVSWGTSVDTDHVDETVRAENSLSARGAIDLPLDVRLVIDWRRPLRGANGNWSGSERWAIDGDWDGEFSAFDLDVSTYANGRRQVGELPFDWELGADLDANVDPIELDGWKLTPTLDAGIDWEDAAITLDGKASLRATLEKLTMRATLSGDMSGIGEPVIRRNEKLSLSASFSGSEVWRPSLSYSGSRSITTHEGVGSATSTNHSLIGHLDWDGEEASNALSITLRLKESSSTRRITASIENDFQTDVTSLLKHIFTPEDQTASDILERESERAPATITDPAEREILDAREPQEAAQIREAETLDESAYPNAFLRLDTEVDFRSTGGEIDLDASTTARLDVSLTEMWGGSLSASYFTGLKSSGGLYHSFLFELTVAVDF